MTAIYNEIEPFAVKWLRNLIAAGHVAPGVVDERSIADLTPADVMGVGQRHFFAGIAGWSYALRLAGVPDDASVWTGSCPCQPLSDAGRRRGFNDERHLWPAWFRVIAECRPAVIFGEQVASGLGWSWLDLVFADLEGAGYACAAADLPAASVGAPHRRQRLFFVAYADEVRRQRAGLARFGFAGPSHRCDCDHVAKSHDWHPDGPRDCNECSCTYFAFGRGMAHAGSEQGRLLATQRQPGRADAQAERSGEAVELADSNGGRRHRESRHVSSRREQPDAARCGKASGMANTQEERCGEGRIGGAHGRSPLEPDRHGHDFWSACEWIPCSDGVSRPVEPGVSPLVTGLPNRVGLLRGYGNAINAEAAAAFIVAALEAAHA